MCQLCSISTLATSARWPKPLESSISDLSFLITCIHTQHVAWKKAEATNTDTDNARGALISLLRTLSGALTSLRHERTAWWKSKTPLIKQLKENVSGQSERKLTELHKINNSAVERIEGMEAKLGGFVRWSLGLEGDVEALLKGEEGKGAIK